MSEKFSKVNDYTLRVTEDISMNGMNSSNYYSGHTQKSELMRIFNFRSAQITTIVQQASYIIGNTSNTGGGAGNSAQVTVQNFDDVQSQLEIELMHAELKKMGGKPPALEDLRGSFTKKPALGRNS
ncbi:MAG TPA: hypothetical protein VHP34_08255 [Alphaproteobacteria bacterium]|jgi:hypothetical protein|nr:hypothetical protein [Alphaproteobacteria bacterium]